MVKISQKNFNLDMDAYIAKRKKIDTVQKPAKKTKKKKESTSEEFKEEEKEYYSEQGSFFQKLIDKIIGESPRPDAEREPETTQEEPSEEIHVEEEYVEVEKPHKKKDQGILTMIKSWFFVDEDTDEVYEQEVEISEPMLEEDIKDILKIQNKWLQQLSAKRIKEFKASDDYKKYKETLSKYKLIKKD